METHLEDKNVPLPQKVMALLIHSGDKWKGGDSKLFGRESDLYMTLRYESAWPIQETGKNTLIDTKNEMDHNK